MSSVSTPLDDSKASVKAVILDYLELMKLRITTMVVITAWCGYYLAAVKQMAPAYSLNLLHTLLGVGLVSSGASAINQVMERTPDSRMARTSRRPLPSQRLTMMQAMIFGAALIGGGVAYLEVQTNLLTALLALGTAAAYVGVYTPLKKISPVSTAIGAIPGAMPPVLGWTAVTDNLSWEPLALFAIVFFWQFPHFLAIAWLYREDYERAGIRMLPVVEPDGHSTIRQIVAYSIGLIVVSASPVLLDMAGRLYLAIALILGAVFFWVGLRLAQAKLPPSAPRSKMFARHILQASVIYLPLLLIAMMVDAR